MIAASVKEPFIKKLSSGIMCYIIPKIGYVQSHAMVVVNYGSADLVAGAKGNTALAGAAHFLEHKLFEDESQNLFQTFSEQNADVNAFTSFGITTYYFNSVGNFEKNLKLLLQMVKKLVLTDENVEKEKGIILQEIAMYKDNPQWQIYYELLNALYVNSPIRYDVAGTPDSVKSFSKDTLEDLYKRFYRPDNMAVICSGDFNPSKAEEIIERAFESKPGPESEDISKRDYGTEPREVNKAYTESQMSVARPVFMLGYKDIGPQSGAHKSYTQTAAATQVLLELLAGEGSELYMSLYKDGLIDESFGGEFMQGTFFGTAMFSGTSDKPKTIAERVSAEADRLRKGGIDGGNLERVKRKLLGRYIQGLDQIADAVSIQADLFTKSANLADPARSIEIVDAESVHRRLNTLFVPEACSLAVIHPKTTK